MTDLSFRYVHYLADGSAWVVKEDYDRAIAEVSALRKALTTGITPQGEFLDWVADRLVWYGDNPNVDFVVSLRERAKAARAALGETP